MRWQYRVLEGDMDTHRARFLDQLNELGAEGWEAISLTPDPDPRGASDWHIALLKRRCDAAAPV